MRDKEKTWCSQRVTEKGETEKFGANHSNKGREGKEVGERERKERGRLQPYGAIITLITLQFGPHTKQLSRSLSLHIYPFCLSI